MWTVSHDDHARWKRREQRQGGGALEVEGAAQQDGPTTTASVLKAAGLVGWACREEVFEKEGRRRRRVSNRVGVSPRQNHEIPALQREGSGVLRGLHEARALQHEVEARAVSAPNSETPWCTKLGSA